MSKLLFPKPCDYSKLDESGFVPKNTYVTDGDIIIGKIIPGISSSSGDIKIQVLIFVIVKKGILMKIILIQMVKDINFVKLKLGVFENQI